MTPDQVVGIGIVGAVLVGFVFMVVIPTLWDFLVEFSAKYKGVMESRQNAIDDRDSYVSLTNYYREILSEIMSSLKTLDDEFGLPEEVRGYGDPEYPKTHIQDAVQSLVERHKQNELLRKRLKYFTDEVIHCENKAQEQRDDLHQRSLELANVFLGVDEVIEEREKDKVDD